MVVSVGVLEPRKRHALLIKRLADALRARELHLAIAGDGDASQLAALAVELGVGDRVTLLGHVDDVPSLMAAGDVYVHAAEVEGVPQAILQSLAAGLPTVATEVIGLREVPGAEVRAVSFSGSGLAEAVLAQLDAPPDPADPAAFAEWTPARVDGAIEAFHARLAGSTCLQLHGR